VNDSHESNDGRGTYWKVFTRTVISDEKLASECFDMAEAMEAEYQKRYNTKQDN
jgi:hypothetical protein